MIFPGSPYNHSFFLLLYSQQWYFQPSFSQCKWEQWDCFALLPRIFLSRISAAVSVSKSKVQTTVSIALLFSINLPLILKSNKLTKTRPLATLCIEELSIFSEFYLFSGFSAKENTLIYNLSYWSQLHKTSSVCVKNRKSTHCFPWKKYFLSSKANNIKVVYQQEKKTSVKVKILTASKKTASWALSCLTSCPFTSWHFLSFCLSYRGLNQILPNFSQAGLFIITCSGKPVT